MSSPPPPAGRARSSLLESTMSQRMMSPPPPSPLPPAGRLALAVPPRMSKTMSSQPFSLHCAEAPVAPTARMTMRTTTARKRCCFMVLSLPGLWSNVCCRFVGNTYSYPRDLAPKNGLGSAQEARRGTFFTSFYRLNDPGSPRDECIPGSIRRLVRGESNGCGCKTSPVLGSHDAAAASGRAVGCRRPAQCGNRRSSLHSACTVASHWSRVYAELSLLSEPPVATLNR